jgi:hypothetical protein
MRTRETPESALNPYWSIPLLLRLSSVSLGAFGSDGPWARASIFAQANIRWHDPSGLGALYN